MVRPSSKARTRHNPLNARRSTGPKTPAGKARYSRNAFRHGLASRTMADVDKAQRITDLVRLIAGSNDDLECLDMARRVAVAELKLLEVRAVRANLAKGIDPRSAAPESKSLVAILTGCERYERRALSRRQKAMRQFDLNFGEVLRSFAPKQIE